MSEFEHLYWEDEVARETGKPLVFGVSQPPDRPGTKAASPWRLPDCRHWRQPFELKDGVRVYASAWMDGPSYGPIPKRVGFAGEPDIGFYLDRSWAAGKVLASPGSAVSFLNRRKKSTTILYPCEDWGAPENMKMFRRSLKWLLGQARKGMIIDIGCMGGHGRTGTALASLLVIQGTSPTTAIRRVQARYCEEAIESHKQRKFIYALPR